MRTTRREFIASSMLGLPAQARSNLVLVLSDQQHWRAAGFMDPFFATPALDRLSREAAVFENSFCTTPQCSPSRASILTGFYPARTGVRGNLNMTGGKALDMPTFAPALQRAGYQTAYFGKWHLGANADGNAGWHESDKREDDASATRNALAFIEKRKKEARPFALLVSYVNPHDVYEYRPGQRRADVDTPLPRSLRPGALNGKPEPQLRFMTDDQGRRIYGQPDSEYRAYRELYREKVKLFDDELGKLLAAIEAPALKSKTLLCVTSDHGDMDAHHGLIWKGPFMYEQLIRVPLLIRAPGARAQRITAHHAVNVDLAPTLLDYAGLDASGFHGASLKPWVSGRPVAPPRRAVYCQYHGKQQWTVPIRTMRTAEWKYSLYRDGGEEMYNLPRDPGELDNVASQVRHHRRKLALRSSLERWMKEMRDDFYIHRAV